MYIISFNILFLIVLGIVYWNLSTSSLVNNCTLIYLIKWHYQLILLLLTYSITLFKKSNILAVQLKKIRA